MKSRMLFAAIFGLGLTSIVLLVLLGLPYSQLSSASANPYGPQPGSISGTVFNDLDSDGILDVGEPGISGVTVCVVGVGCTSSALNGGYSFEGIDPDTYERPAIFDVIQKAGDIKTEEMARTFNLGLGYLAVIDAADSATAASSGFLIVGELVSGDAGVELGYANG